MNAKVEPFSSMHANLWSQYLIDSQTLTGEYRRWIDEVSSSPLIPRTVLGRQLDTVYRLIMSNDSRGKNRDTFAIEMTGFDQHFR